MHKSQKKVWRKTTCAEHHIAKESKNKVRRTTKLSIFPQQNTINNSKKCGERQQYYKEKYAAI